MPGKEFPLLQNSCPVGCTNPVTRRACTHESDRQVDRAAEHQR
jgi:hypothetical protein